MTNNAALPYKNLLRWLRETHVIVDDDIQELPVFKCIQQKIKIYFNYVSLTGFHKIKRVVRIEKEREIVLNERQVDQILKQEAAYRVKSYVENQQTEKATTENHLLSIINCQQTDEYLINNKLFNISLQSENQEQEKALLEQLKQQLQLINNPLAEVWASKHFIPAISTFFPILDGIGSYDFTPFWQQPKRAGGEQPGRLWLINPLNPILDKSNIPSLDFFEMPNLSNGWSMRDATMTDLNQIHYWMNDSILKHTFCQDYSLKEWEFELTRLINSPFTRPVILSLQNEECAYLEFYRPAGVEMGQSFLFDPAEIGFHLGIIKEELINRKFGRQLIGEIVINLLAYPKKWVSGLMGEPEINNLGMFKAVMNTGLTFHGASIAMPHKCSYITRSYSKKPDKFME